MKEEQIPIRADGREWVGLAAIVLDGCGLSREEIRSVVAAGDDEVLRRIWSCIRTGRPVGSGQA